MADKHTPEMQKDHRARLRARAAKDGADTLEPYRLLELFLFDIIPRVDTYPTAHRLLDRFGTLDGVFSAPREELLEVFGVGPKTADHIVAAGEMMSRSVMDRLMSAPVTSENMLYPVMSWLFRGKEIDSMAVICFDESDTVIQYRWFPCGAGTDTVEAYIRNSSDAFGMKSIVFAHRHPNGFLEPSADDLNTTRVLISLCRECGAALKEHYIVTDTDAVGIIGTRFERGENHG